MNEVPFITEIAYSVQNEDYLTEMAVLSRIDSGRPLRVLTVASSGENALSFLTQQNVERVDALDLNPSQIHLSELRLVALERLSRDEQLRLFGAHPGYARAGDDAARLALFDQISPHLPEAQRVYWQAHRETDIAFGVHHVGRNDQLMRAFRVALHEAGFEPLHQKLHEADLPAWQAAYTRVGTPDRIREVFGIQAEALAQKIAGIVGRLGECHFRFLQRPDALRNPFVTTVFADSYATAAGELGYPLYLQAAGQEALRRSGARNRLRLHVSNMISGMQALAEEADLYDLISISNIADWMTAEQFAGVAAMARDCLRDDGVLLARTASGNTVIYDAMAQFLHVDDAFNRALTLVERGPWFRAISAGFKR
jgi:S-adenosylmethionine:diacylglycerol 3-amino-3-carboxypropyl transferase